MSAHAPLALAACALWLAACFGPGGSGSGANAGGHDERARDGGGFDGPVRRPPLDPPPDAPDTEPGSGAPPDGGLTLDQTACLGLDSPICAGCHFDPMHGALVLRPTFAPPQPPDLSFSVEDLQACGVDVVEALDADAGR